MANSKPLILLSNDDGYQAKGINELIKALRDEAELVVVAPDGPRSGASGAITSSTPICYEKVKEEPGFVVYKCNGTPVDCTKLALHTIVERTPDLIIGGINHGDNSSVNVHYSGTMGIVIEGALKGIPSIGFSLCNHAPDADFSFTLPYVRQIVKATLANGLPYGTCLNVNFPDTDSLKGIRVCRQTDGVWINEFAECSHPRDKKYFWLTGSYKNYEPNIEGTDHWALDNGYVAITPTQVDVTAYALMEKMKSWNWE